MSNETSHAEQDIALSFQERIDVLFNEIDLAVKWDRPSILFAIYKSAAIRDEVNALLQERLRAISQKTRSIKTDQFDFISEISQLPDLTETVLLIDGFNWECGSEGVRVLTEFNKHREYFIDNNIRAIFWLFEEEVSEFAANATECWILRHRVVEFMDLPQQDQGAEFSTETMGNQVENSLADENMSESSFEEVVNLAESKMANATHANELLNLGILNWRKSNPQGALRYLQVSAEISEFLANQSLQAQCQNALALVHAELGNIDDAVTAYQKAISLSPESGFLWNNLGQLLAKNERNEEAINAFKKALTCSPKDFLSWDGVGHIYLKMGLYLNAISAFEKALEIAPYYEFSWSGIGQAYLESGELEKAIDPLRKAVELNTHSVEAWKNLAKCYTQQDRDLDAINVYQKAVEFHPQNATLWGELGRLQLENQGYVESISAFQRVLAINPQCAKAKMNLAFAQFQIGDYETSAAIYEESIPLIDDQTTRVTLWNQLGDTYMHLKEYEKAIAAYEQADHPPEDSKILTNENAQPILDTQSPDPEVEQEMEQEFPAEERGEDMNEANQVFDTRTAKEWNQLGNAHLKKGAYNDAITAYTKAIELAPGESWAYIQNLAHVHYQKGKVRGKLTSGQADEPDIWEGDDEPDTTPIFGLDDIPTPERFDSSEGLVQNNQADNNPLAQLPTGPDEGEVFTGISETANCCSNNNNGTIAQPVEGESNIMSGFSDIPFDAPEETGSEGFDPSTQPIITHQTLDTTPRNSIDWNELGNSYTRSKKYNEAIEAYKKAIEMNPKFGQPYSNLGLIYYHIGKFDVAVLLFKKSIDLLETQEERASSWNKLGDSYRRLGDYGNALIAYQKSSEMAPPVSPIMARARATLLENIVAG
jgi:tetratricopeptide (TPR) repeat protein